MRSVRVEVFNINLYFATVVLVFLSFSAFGQADRVSDVFSASVGRILLYQNLNTQYEVGNPGLGHYYLPEMIKMEYKEFIAGLEAEDRLNFVWGVISFAKFGAHGTAEFTALIHDCCEAEFIESANQFMELADRNREKSANYVDESMVHKADFFVNSLAICRRNMEAYKSELGAQE